MSVNQTLKDNLKLNDICHIKKIKFILANATGLFTQLFCDFQEHICSDSNGEQPITGAINDITIDGILTVVNGATHSLEEGDTVKISEKIYKVKVLNRTQIKLEKYHEDTLKIGGDYEQVKIPFEIKFKSLRECITLNEDSSDNCSKYIDDIDVSDKHQIMHQLFNNITADKTKNTETFDELFKKLENQFNKTKGCLIAPICSVIGGIAAQEVLKAASSKFIPFKQFYYFDCTDCYYGSNGEEKEYLNSRYFDMVKIFGGENFEKIKNFKIFLVGSGAIGCENIKNFVMSGLCSAGKLSVTDMDSIEASNLNRQFLFRTEDISKMKSDCAVKHACTLNEDYTAPVEINSDISDKKIDHAASTIADNNHGTNYIHSHNNLISKSLVSYTLAVNVESENTFSDNFLKDHDLIANALDNVEARAYMDKRCIQMRRPLIDAGTLGTKGHVQVVIPFMSETYSSSVDPQDKSIPLCTIKSFPYSIEHTIEWAMGEFRTQFNERVINVKEYLNSKDPALEEEYETTPLCVEGCFRISLALFVNYFSTSISKLLSSFGPDHVDSEGNLFWSPPKKIPNTVPFNINDKLHITFLISSANLYAECYGIRKIKIEELYAYLENILSMQEPEIISFGDEKVDLSVLNVLEFDKDTWHVDFIYSAANLRARNYAIKEQSKHYIKGIAGRIIPAIATTTAVVSGLSTLEILKYIFTSNVNSSGKDKSADKNIENNESTFYKNSYLDLAIPFLASTDLVRPKSYQFVSKDIKINFNTWTRIEFKNDSLSEVIKSIEEFLKIEVSMISIGSRVIFWNLSKKYEVNLNKKISDLCNKKNGQKLVYIEVLPEDDYEMMDISINFD